MLVVSFFHSVWVPWGEISAQTVSLLLSVMKT